MYVYIIVYIYRNTLISYIYKHMLIYTIYPNSICTTYSYYIIMDVHYQTRSSPPSGSSGSSGSQDVGRS